MRSGDHIEGGLPQLEFSKTLLVLPCSRKKATQARRLGEDADSIVDSLPGPLAQELRDRRAANAEKAKVDEATLLPAVERYTGRLYAAAGVTTFDTLLRSSAAVVIISGGYGVVLAREPIGCYDQCFKPSMWPEDLIGRCLVAYAERISAKIVVGLFPATCGYAEYVKAFRRAPWPRTIRILQMSPEQAKDDKVQSKAAGEALAAISRGRRLQRDWRSSDGLRMEVEWLG